MTFTASEPVLYPLLQAVARAPREWWVWVGTRAYRLAPDNSGQPMIVVMPPGLWSPDAAVGGNLTSLRFSGMSAVVVRFRELLRVG